MVTSIHNIRARNIILGNKMGDDRRIKAQRKNPDK